MKRFLLLLACSILMAQAPKKPSVIIPDGAIPERFIHYRVDLSGCLDVTFTNPKDFRVESDKYESKVTIQINYPGIADCTMEGK